MRLTNILALTAGAAAVPRSPRDISLEGAFNKDPTTGPSGFRTDAISATTSTNWAGAVLIGTGFTSVTGTITVPSPKRPANAGTGSYSGSAWVGIDGDTCRTSILQTGILWQVSASGAVSYGAWYEWIPASSVSFNLAVKAGDVMRFTVTAAGKTGGTALIENLTTGKSATHTFTGQRSALCETNAEWIVEAFQSSGRQVNLADFGTVTFTNVSVTSGTGTASPAGATILNMRPSAQIVTNCAASESSVSCSYV